MEMDIFPPLIIIFSLLSPAAENMEVNVFLKLASILDLSLLSACNLSPLYFLMTVVSLHQCKRLLKNPTALGTPHCDVTDCIHMGEQSFPRSFLQSLSVVFMSVSVQTLLPQSLS